MNEEKESAKGRIRQKNVKIFVGIFIQGGQKKANLLI